MRPEHSLPFVGDFLPWKIRHKRSLGTLQNVLTACVMAFCNLWTRDLYDRRSTRWKRAMQAVMTHTPLNPLVHTPAIMCWACYQDCWTSEWVDV